MKADFEWTGVHGAEGRVLEYKGKEGPIAQLRERSFVKRCLHTKRMTDYTHKRLFSR